MKIGFAAMFVYSLKASTLKFFAVIVLSVAAIITLITLIPSYEPASAVETDKKINYGKITTNEDRINFLSQFDIAVSENPIQETEVTIPAEFDKVYTAYNTLQQKQGLDLSKYRKKTVTRYTYEVTNYPDYEGKVLVNIIIYKNKVIGGDVCSADVNGFVHGFTSDITLP